MILHQERIETAPKGIFGTYKFQNWRTPRTLFDALHAALCFDLDAFASPHNALLPRYWTEQDDALSQDWSGLRVFANPPFKLAGHVLPLARKAEVAVVIMAWSTLFTRGMKNHPPDHLLLPVNRIKFLPPVGCAGNERPQAPYGACVAIYGVQDVPALQGFNATYFCFNQRNAPMTATVKVTEKDLARANLMVNGDGTEIIPMPPADHPAETMTDNELLAYAAKQDGIYHELSCRAVIPFFRRGWAFSIICERHKGQWTAFCKEHGIGRTWATHARKFYAYYKEESAIPAGKTLNELLDQLGIIHVQKVNEDEPDEQPQKKARKSRKSAAPNPDDTGAGVEEGADELPEPGEVEPVGEQNDSDGANDEGADESPDEDGGPPAKEESLLLFLTKVKALLDDQDQDKDQIDWSKEDLGACKEMALEIVQCCDNWINEVDDHAFRKAS